MAKKQIDPTICSAPSCSSYKVPGSEYCFYHRKMYPAKKEKEVKETNPFNSNGFKTQVQLFKSLWGSRKRKCFVTNQDLNIFDGSVHFISIFAHILRKSAFTEFRFYQNNIVFLSPDFKGQSVHHLFDNGTLGQILKFEVETGKSFETLFELEDIRYKEYEKSFGKKAVKRKIVDKYFESKKTK